MTICIEDVVNMIKKEKEDYWKHKISYSKQKELCDSIENDKRKITHEKEILEILKLQYDETKDVYSKKIYEVLSEIKPDLVIRISKEVVSWDSVFGNDYSLLSKNQIRSLIPLIENDGGRYRLSLKR